MGGCGREGERGTDRHDRERGGERRVPMSVPCNKPARARTPVSLQPNGEPYSKSLGECEQMLRELIHVDRTSMEKQI